ncbi:DUF559 domain-containing protein [Pseudactinotalea suaedae]|uniref:DUF559 domain-containing protein n=1 Tax=Pseudactinotalea suaedae TaxID=1524924 RepID=UPI0012E2849E|nr:DUF559 domain-containing protein [Pseudactinotalea suaedae]
MADLPKLLTRAHRHPSWLSRAHHQGLIVPTLPGVYLRTDVADSVAWRARAALVWRPDMILLGEVAASWTFWREIPVTAVDVATRTEIDRPGYRFHRRSVPPHLVGRYGDFRTSLPALTALDLIGTHGLDAIDHVLRSRRVRIEDLFAALEATPGRYGNVDRRRMLVRSRTEPWSAAERLAHAILTGAGISGWRSNVPLRLEGQQYFLDIAFSDIKLVLEIDGREIHEQAAVFESDRERQNALVLAGWTVLRFTWLQLHRRPDYVLESVNRGRRLATRLQRIRRQIADSGEN